jgi:Holliday junction resolvase RusA-like endonuclease
VKIDFFVSSTPEPKGRTRNTINHSGGRPTVRSITPKNTREYEAEVRTEFRLRYGHYNDFPIFSQGIPLQASLDFIFLRPESKRKGKNRREYPAIKPDYDNLAKSVSDALNGWAYHDDSQIVTTVIRKRYTEDIREVGAQIVITEEVA